MTKFIDFNNLPAGTVVDNEFSSQGVTISAVGGANQAMIFDTANPTGGDADLGTTNLNGALIISEDGDSNDPDDNGGGGTFKFVFDTPADVNRLTFLDIEETATVTFFAPNGHVIETIEVNATGNNGQTIEDFDVSGVARMEVTLHGSGAIDNLVFDDSGLDGVVEGDNDANLIDGAFDEDPDGDCIDANDQILPGEGPNDDIVDAFGGDDTVLSGQADDEVYAGSGNDSVQGGAGDDLIFGDSNYAGPNAGVTVRESFEWNESGIGTGVAVDDFTQNTGNVDVTFSTLTESAPSVTRLSTNDQNVDNIDDDGAPVDDESSLDNVLNGHGNSADFQLEFSAAVEDVSFRVNDIDGDGVVRVRAFDANGVPIVVNLEGGERLTLLDTDGVAGNDTADSNGGYLPDTSEEYSLLVSIAGPVSRIVIEHDQNGSDNSGINITDVYFDAPLVDDGLPGNDTLIGDAGDDTIFGEEGDDLLRGGSGNDSLVGGEGSDRLEGGSGDDILEGGAARDTIVGGGGDDTAFGGDGNDEIWVGSGDDSVDGGADNDWIHGQTGDDTLNGDAGNDMVFGEDGNDVLTGGEGDDTLSGGADADTIFGGAGDEVDGGSGGFNANPALNTDLDVLDLTGQGPFFLDNVTPDVNGNGINGTVVFVDGDGNPNGLTLSFAEIEDVIGDEVNRGPDAVDDTATVDEDGSVDIAVLGNDTDPDGDDLRVTEASSPDGDVTINPDGTITFSPTENFNGPTTITYTITDDNGGEDTATVTVDVTPVNDDPVANDDTATVEEDGSVDIPVLANDTDVDGDDLRVTDATSPDGEVTINPDGTITFSPNENFNGPTTITYTVTDDQGGEDTATVTVDVTPANDGPVANDDTATVEEDGSVDIPVLANDTDLDGDDLRVTEATSPDGEVTINPDGTITFSPNENFNGPTTITYTVTDDQGGEDTATVTVEVTPVNDAPDAVNDTETTDEDTPVTIDVLANDTDVDGDPLTITGASVPADQGAVEIVDNQLLFTPAENFNGDATISYSIEDGNGGTDTADAVVTVTPVNDDPVAVDDIAETMEDEPVVVDLIGNDTDVDGDPLTIGSVSVPADQGDVVDNGDGTVTFTPAPNFNGPATITYTVVDGQGGEDEGVATVNVGAVNDGPTAVDDSAETDEDTPVTIDVVGNDTDPDGDDLTITGASVPADQGTVDVVDNQLLFTPAENFNGDATITYTIADGNGGTDTADVGVTVNPVNDDPVAVDDIETTDEDTPVVVDLIGNDTDVDGDPLTIGSVSVPADQGDVVDNGDGTVTFTPAPNFNGPATITYTVVDGQDGEDEGEAVVSVGAVNDGPVANDDAETTEEDTPVTIDVVGNDTDDDGDDITVISAVVPADQGTVDIVDNELLFTPAENFNGDATITYTISDGNGGTDTAEVVVDVTPVNDDPVANDDVATVEEDGSVDIPVLDNDTDVDGDPLRVTEATSPDGDVTINDDGTITFTPDENFNGPTTITYTVTDDQGGEDTATVDVNVTAGNDGPVANDDADTANEDGPAIDIDLTANDTDLDGDDLEIQSIDTTGTLGSVSVNPDDDSVSYDANGAFESLGVGETATDTFTYVVEDGEGGTDTATVTVTVEGANDGPTANDDTSDTDFDTPVTFDVLANDTDPDTNDVLSITGATSPDGTVDDNGDGTLTFTPTPGFEGPATINYSISDGNGGTDDAVWTVNVAEQPLDGIVSGTDDGDLIDEDYTGDPEGDVVDGGDNIFSTDPEDEDDDIIEAGGGDDTVEAGDGDDEVDGGTGDDVINGGDGSDTVDGGEGDDVIDTGNGDLAPDLGFPNDDGTPVPGFPFGFAADEDPEDDRDSVDGGAGDDTISTGDDRDTITGGTGDDVIDGGIDDDRISGDEGDDRIVGGEGNDLIEGGVGDDTIFAGNDPDLGLDQLNIEDDGSNPLFPADPRPDNGVDTVFGGDGDDVIFGADDADLLFGDAGNDTIDGEIDDDLIDGGAGDDSLLGGQGDDTVAGGDGDDTIDGGIGNDDLLGGADADTFVNVNAGDVVDGNEEVTDGVDFDTLDLTGSAPTDGSLKVVFDGGNPENGVVNFFDSNGDDAGQLVFSNIENVIPCFTPGTRIATPSGEQRVEELGVGDRVITRDNGIQTICWVGQRAMSGAELAAAAHLRPVLIQQGALGNGLPERDMLVSPQHRVLMASDKTALYFDESEVLVAAKHLTDMDGIDVVEVSETTYIHLMFDQHEVILSDGAWTESFQPGDQTLASMGDAQRAEILELFPELETETGIRAYAAARRSLKKHEARLLT